MQPTRKLEADLRCLAQAKEACVHLNIPQEVAMLPPKVRVRRIYLLFGTFLFFLLLVVTREALAANRGITLTGQVNGRQMDPKQFVSVSLEGPGHYAAITDAKGIFTIKNFRPGRYTVRVRQGDFVAVFSLDVNGGYLNLKVKW